MAAKKKSAPKKTEDVVTYRVLVSFADDHDGGRVYRAGKDEYPRAGLKPTTERIVYLGSDKNRLGRPVIGK